MSTRSVSVGSAITAFLCLSVFAGVAMLLLLASGVTARADDSAAMESGALQREIRQIEIHTRKQEDLASADIPFDTVEQDAELAGDPFFDVPSQPYQSKRIVLGIDRAQLMRLNGSVDTIVIGNPVIADAAVYDQSTLVLTGKAFGETNIIVLDSMGNVIRSAEIRVGQPNDVVVINRGANQITYSCAPHCSRTLRIGDQIDAFSSTLTQTQGIIELNRGGQTAR